MNRPRIITKVFEILIDKLGVERDDIHLGSFIQAGLGADSLGVVELTIAVDQTFEDIKITDEEWEQVKTVGDAVDLIEEKYKFLNRPKVKKSTMKYVKKVEKSKDDIFLEELMNRMEYGESKKCCKNCNWFDKTEIRKDEMLFHCNKFAEIQCFRVEESACCNLFELPPESPEEQ